MCFENGLLAHATARESIEGSSCSLTHTQQPCTLGQAAHRQAPRPSASSRSHSNPRRCLWEKEEVRARPSEYPA